MSANQKLHRLEENEQVYIYIYIGTINNFVPFLEKCMLVINYVHYKYKGSY